MQNNLKFIRKLPVPMELKEQYPLKAEYAAKKVLRDKEIADIFTGKDNRLLLVIGPCSADREDAVIEYICRLARIQEKVSDKLFIIPRIYTNKPRTTGDGYKGMLHQPDPTEAPDLLRGIIAIRKIHIRAMEETGFSCADEMLYPENYRYLSDILSYVAIDLCEYVVNFVAYKMNKKEKPVWDLHVVLLIIAALFIVYFFVPTSF